MKKVGGVIRKVFPRASVISIKKFKKGSINETYDVKITNPAKELVLRIYPKEGWKAVKEAYLYNLISKKTDVPVPNVYFVDYTEKLLPNAFIILSKIKGKELTKKNKKLIEKAGECLAKLHKIKFKKFGWIIHKQIKPGFSKWADFCGYDLKHKLKGLKKYNKISDKRIKAIENYFNKNKYLLDIKSKPCLLHKDYHLPHILASKNRITGIIDIEWAISGHNELDIIKSLSWVFNGDDKLEKIFLKGYKKYNKISKEFSKRRKLYELWIAVSSALFSCELSNDKWLRYNMKQMRRILK